MLPCATQPSPEEDGIKMFLKRLQRSNGGRSKQLHREDKSKKPAERKHTTHTNTHTLPCSASVSSSVRPGHVLSFLIYCCLRQPFLCLLICCVIIFAPTVEHLQQYAETPPRWNLREGPDLQAPPCAGLKFQPCNPTEAVS